MAKDFSDTGLYRNSVYAIYEGSTKKVVYVGLTSYVRDGGRFIEHVNNDVGYPWHKSFFLNDEYQSTNDEDWPYYPRKLYDCKDFTQLETAASEQFYWEAHDGLTNQLKNKVQPLRLCTFLKYKTDKTYRATVIKFPPGWRPKV